MAKSYASGASRIGSAEEILGLPALTLRDYFAMHAPAPPPFWKVTDPLRMAHWAYTWADAMLKAREYPTAPDRALPAPL